MTREELQRVIDVIVEELAAGAPGGGASGVRCHCHSVLADCCPDRLRA